VTLASGTNSIVAKDTDAADNTGTSSPVVFTLYREAVASVAALPTPFIVHVGQTVNQALTISNTDPNDGYSENLIASVTGTTRRH